MKVSIFDKSIFSMSKNVFGWGGVVIGYEIEKAIKIYKLPIIIAYIGDFNYMKIPDNYTFDIYGYKDKGRSIRLTERLPKKIREAISILELNCIHIPFNKDVIKECINKYGCNDEDLKGHKNIYGLMDFAFSSIS